MTSRIDQSVLQVREEIVGSPARRACTEHSFDMPSRIYVAMAALLFGFLAVMAVGFAHPGLVVPMGVNFIFLTAFFAIPAIFVGAAPSGGSGAPSWARFRYSGIRTETGHNSAGEATVLTLLLPFLIFCWAIAVVAIAASV